MPHICNCQYEDFFIAEFSNLSPHLGLFLYFVFVAAKFENTFSPKYMPANGIS
jgi:hypothetical protein